jgi:hypothetical protein
MKEKFTLKPLLPTCNAACPESYATIYKPDKNQEFKELEI